MPSHTFSGFHPPRIYCCSPGFLAQREGWGTLLTHVSAMHFDSILLAGSAAAFPATNPDADRLIEEFAETCTRAGLRLFLDLELDRFACDHPLLEQYSQNFFLHRQDAQALPDPRRSNAPIDDTHAQLRLDAEGMQIARDYWHARIAGWIAAGICGFRCVGIARIPSSLWSELIANTHASRTDIGFMAWTPGCTPEHLHAVQDCGFDAVFSSDAWWDYRAGWFAEEHQRLSATAAVIAAPEDPGGDRLCNRLQPEDSATARCAYRRALLTAAASGDGLLIVQGFEFGAATALAQLQQDTRWLEQALFDLSQEVSQANRRLDTHSSAATHSIRMLSAPDADIALFLRETANAAHTSATVTAINTDLNESCLLAGRLMRERAAGWKLTSDTENSADAMAIDDDTVLTLLRGEVRFFSAQPIEQILSPAPKGRQAVVRAARIARIAIENITPQVDGGRFPIKRVAGTAVAIEADIFSDGHDLLAAVVLWRAADEKDWHEVTMQMTGNDRWRGMLPLEKIGRHLFLIEAWRDNFATYCDELGKKVHAGLDVTLEIQEGRQFVEKLIALQPADSAHIAALKKLLKQLPAANKKKGGGRNNNDDDNNSAAAITLLLSIETTHLMRQAAPRDFATRNSVEYRIDAERKAAEFANWYELFPRSQSGDAARHGTFDDVIKRLPAVRDMGFDTLYFPPIHPIGRKNMKGKNNSLTPGAGDPGSPYAIGSVEGGHDAIHPQLGTLDDFRRLLAAAKEHGLEIALDFAIQCSPDHPWLKQHPEWFAWRPDGSIRYAENPPKKYEDIVNVDFYAEDAAGSAIPDLWIALRDVVLMWVSEDVRVFRVDNPHTKPLPFWEWMIGDIRSRAPDTIFLAEAFTRPKPMYRLAKAGFSQSYTYFTWRHGKQEFIDYLNELSSDGPREFFRPHFFVNTPDINPYFLQHSGRPGFLIRAALAATLSGLWGVYSGFELCEAQAVTGKEEYLDSEKYEIRAWDWQRPGNIVHEVTLLNRIRKGNPALHTHLNAQFHFSSSDQILYFSKATSGSDGRFGDNVLLVAINLDPFAAHDAAIELPLWKFGLPDHAALHVEELMSESRFTWHGKQQQIHLDPQQMPFAIWRVRPLENRS